MNIELYGKKFHFEKGTDAAFVVGDLKADLDRTRIELEKAKALLATAPELLAYLKEDHKRVLSDPGDSANAAVQARLIAKAEGTGAVSPESDVSKLASKGYISEQEHERRIAGLKEEHRLLAEEMKRISETLNAHFNRHSTTESATLKREILVASKDILDLTTQSEKK